MSTDTEIGHGEQGWSLEEIESKIEALPPLEAIRFVRLLPSEKGIVIYTQPEPQATGYMIKMADGSKNLRYIKREEIVEAMDGEWVLIYKKANARYTQLLELDEQLAQILKDKIDYSTGKVPDAYAPLLQGLRPKDSQMILPHYFIILTNRLIEMCIRRDSAFLPQVLDSMEKSFVVIETRLRTLADTFLPGQPKALSPSPSIELEGGPYRSKSLPATKHGKKP